MGGRSSGRRGWEGSRGSLLLLAYHIPLAHNAAQTGSWAMNTRNCFMCPFQEVCNTHPNDRLAHLNADFEPWEWNPAQSRQDPTPAIATASETADAQV